MNLMSRMMRIALAVGLAAGASIGGALTSWAPGAGAAVNGHCGDVVVGALHAGEDLREGGLESPDLHVYTEHVNLKLSPAVTVDFRNVGTYKTPDSLPNPQPTIADNTMVNSYLLHSDPI